MNGLKTEEFGTVKNNKKLYIIIGIIVALLLLLLGIYLIVSNIEKEKEKQKEIITVNEELKDIKYYAVRDNYIVGLDKNLNSKNIYNLLQGTGQFNDFKDFYYYDDNIYVLFSDNNIYKISLTSGNKLYELQKYLTLEGIPNFIIIDGNNIYTNDTNKLVVINKKKNTKTVLGEYINFNKVELYNNSLYILQDKELDKFDLKEGTNTKLAENVDSIKLYENVLVYNIGLNYYGINLKTGETISIVENSKNLVIYNNKIYYLKDDGIYTNNKKEQLIYKVHYNNLEDFTLIGNYIEVRDFNNNGKESLVLIDLNNKYQTKIITEKFTKVQKYIRKEK